MTTQANNQTSGSTLPTTGVNMGVATMSTAAASISAELALIETYSQGMKMYANQLKSYFKLQMDDAQNSAHELREAGKDQMWGEIVQGIGQIAQGGLSVVGGMQGLNALKEEPPTSSLKNAKEYRSTLDERLGTSSEARVSDINEREMVRQGRSQDFTTRDEQNIKSMKDSNYDFGKEITDEQRGSIKRSSVNESRAVKDNCDEYIKNTESRLQADRQERVQKARALSEMWNGVGAVATGAGGIGKGIFENEASNHQGEQRIWEAAQNAASSMLNNAQTQWNTVLSNLNQLFQLMMQIAAANKVQG